MKSPGLARLGAFAFGIAGALIFLHGLSLYLSFSLPSVMMVVWLLMTVGVLSFYFQVRHLHERSGRMGGMLGSIGVALGIFNALGDYLAPNFPRGPEFVLPWGVTILTMVLSLYGGLLCLGWAALRSPSPWRVAPLATAVLAPPVFALGTSVVAGGGHMLAAVGPVLTACCLWGSAGTRQAVTKSWERLSA